MRNNQPHVSIIMLNWNGWQDTLECLETVFRSDYENFSVILIDNASEDESIEKIKEWGNGKTFSTLNEDYADLFSSEKKSVTVNGILHTSADHYSKDLQIFSKPTSKERTLLIIENANNDGFAIGTNLGIKIAQRLFNSDYYFLLNNDTVVEMDALSKLIKNLSDNPEFGVLTSAIHYYEDRKKVANLGGKLTSLGNRKYFTSREELEMEDITFVTGCAMIIRKKVLADVGLLTERFFFGEEDFEYCLRLQKAGAKLGCATDSIIYHKISSSSDKLFGAGLKKKFIHLLNRLVNMRAYYSPLYWHFWKTGFSSYCMLWLLIRYKVPFIRAFRFAWLLNRHSRLEADVRKETIDKIFTQIKL